MTSAQNFQNLFLNTGLATLQALPLDMGSQQISARGKLADRALGEKRRKVFIISKGKNIESFPYIRVSVVG